MMGTHQTFPDLDAAIEPYFRTASFFVEQGPGLTPLTSVHWGMPPASGTSDDLGSPPLRCRQGIIISGAINATTGHHLSSA